MTMFRLPAVAGLVLALCAAPALAQGIDCGKARAPLDRAICGSPELLEQDHAMSTAFAQALARDPDSAAALRQSQIQWLRDRAAACGNGADPAATQTCLKKFFTARMAVLTAQKPAPPSAAVAPPAPAAPAAPAPPPAPVAAVQEPLVAPAPPTAPVDAAEASLDNTTLPPAGQMQTLLHVTHPGRFAIIAKSPTGTALQLVDMLTGPTDIVGQAGQTDGRLDALLDVGTYKLRAFGAPHASGDVALSVTPFRDAGPPLGAPMRGKFDAELGDFQQRRFWLEVAGDTPIRIEAAGRALADLRLFRNGRELAALTPAFRTIEPTTGHPLVDLVLQGALEPGTYQLVAYGGRPLPWADGAAAQPFHLRQNASEALEAGWVAGRIGPFGSELLSAGPAIAALRLDLPEAAAATLRATVGDRTVSTAIDRRQREPTAWLALTPDADHPTLVEVSGAEGQPFQLRALSGVLSRSVVRDGSYWMSVDAAGFGGDEPPLTYVLTQRRLNARPAVRASSAPKISPTQAWRRRFNLRGPLALVFEVTVPGPLAVRADGVPVQAAIAAFGAALQARADGSTPSSWDLAAGFYVLQLTPAPNAAGIVDLTLGPPGMAADLPTTPSAADPAIPISLVTLEGNGQLELFSSSATGGAVGLLARPAPVDLFRGPLALTLAAGAGMDVPVRLPADGALLATEIGRGPVTASFEPVAGPTAGRIGTVHLPPADHERTVALSWREPTPTPPAIPPVPPQPPLTPLAGGAQKFLDLEQDASSSFGLTVPEGGLFRVETLGRLHTTGTIGSAFIPVLDHADGNGSGHNMLIQRFLRAGQYRVTVGAVESAGHLGVTARPAPLLSGATLVPGGSVRARLPADSGVAFPLLIADQGRYHLDLQSLAAGLTARLEDAEGWPMLAAGDLSTLEQDLAPGRYRLLVQPAGIAARVVARLARVEVPPPRTGHGPFPLPFDTTQKYVWREPPGRDDPRTPDSWTFSLQGEARVKLAIGDGMIADLHRDGATDPVARFTHATQFAATLPPGLYRLSATSLGRNDRLDYTVALSSEELQPDRARTVTLPATIKFSLAEDRVVSLTSFGKTPLRAVLSTADGHVVGRYGDRGDDWNIGISRLLPAGAYQLALATAAPPAATDVTVRDPTRNPAESDNTNAGNDDQAADKSDDTASSDQGQSASMADQGNSDTSTPDSNKPDDDKTGSDKTENADNSDTGETAKTTEIRLALPAPRAPVAASATGSLALDGGGVHRLTLPPAAPGTLTIAAAASTAELALALEQQDAAGGWRTATIAQGTAPVIGMLGGTQAAPSRISVWTVDGGTEPIRFAACIVTAQPQAVGVITPAAVPLAAEMPQRLAAALVAVPGAGPVALAGDATGMAAVSAPGRALTPLDAGLVLPQSDRLWLLAPRAAPLTLTAVKAQSDHDIALAIPQDGQALLPGAAVPVGHTRVWLAASGLGQPGLDAGRGMGVAGGTALALAGDGVTKVFNAGGTEALRLRVTALDLADQTPRILATPLAEALPPHSALPVKLPEGNHAVAFDLAPGTAAIADWRSAAAVTVWTGDAAVSRGVQGGWTDVLLVNTGASPAPVRLGWTALAGPPIALVPGIAQKRFYGAAGSLDLPVSGSGRLVVAGGTALMIGPGGQVTQGRTLPLAGAGRLVLTHGPGLLAAWIEGGPSPWPEPPAQPVTLPQTLAMHDMAMTLAFTADAPLLLHARSTAPVILALGRGAPTLFPAGAEFNHAIAPGAASLRVISPHDGPLSGTLELSAEPITPAGEGVGAEVAVAPGGAAAFGFAVTRAGPVGVGVRAEPDQVSVRLLAQDGRLIGEGIAQLQTLPVGRYVLEANVPDDAATIRLRPAIVGIKPRPSGPPPDVVNTYLALVGRAPK